VSGILLAFASCQNDSDQLLKKSGHEVSPQLIHELAVKLFSPNSPSARGFDMGENKTIHTDTIYLTPDGANALHVINFVEGGWVVMAADNRMSPVLAYNETGDFITSSRLIPEVVSDWIDGEIELLEYITEQSWSKSANAA